MKILHTSDWHLGKSLYDFSLLEDQAHFIDWLLDLLTAQPVDVVIIAGDIYDRPIPSSGAVALYDFFLSRAVGDMGIPVLAIAGNHDSAGRLQFGSSLYQRSGYHVVGSVQRELHTVALSDEHGQVVFTLLPYLHLAEARIAFPGEAVRTFNDAYRLFLSHHRQSLKAGVRNIAVAHGFFSNIGSALDAQPFLTSDSEIGVGGMDIVDSACFDGFDYVALGHLHAPQKTTEHIRYSGSPLKYSLSEETQAKAVTLIDLGPKGELEICSLPVPALRNVRTVRGTLKQLMEPSFHDDKRFDDYVFADIEGEECAYPMQKLRTLFPHLLGLRFVRQEIDTALPLPQMQTAQRMARLSTEELFCRFYRDCRGQDLPSAHRLELREVLQELDQEEVQ